MKMLRFIVLLPLFLSVEVFAHTIIFKDLRVVYGTVTSQTGQYLLFTSDGGNKKVRKDTIGKIIIQDVKDPEMLKKFLKKVKDSYPNYVTPKATELPPSVIVTDIEYESAKILVKEIEEEERVAALNAKTRGAILGAFLFPGRGQYLLESPKTGILYGTLFWSLVAGATYQHFQAVSKNELYRKRIASSYRDSFFYNPYLDDARSVEFFLYGNQIHRNIFDDYQSSLNMRNQLIAGAVGVYLVQLFHTMYSVKLIRAESENLKLSFMFFPARLDPNLGSSAGMDSYFLLQWRF
jgi:hypothetical protein